MDSPPHFDDILTAGTYIVGVLITASTAIILELVRRVRAETRVARVQATLAARRSEPTGNGFASEVLRRLTNIERDIGGLREENRTERRERLHFEDQIINQLKDQK